MRTLLCALLLSVWASSLWSAERSITIDGRTYSLDFPDSFEVVERITFAAEGDWIHLANAGKNISVFFWHEDQPIYDHLKNRKGEAETGEVAFEISEFWPNAMLFRSTHNEAGKANFHTSEYLFDLGCGEHCILIVSVDCHDQADIKATDDLADSLANQLVNYSGATDRL